MAKRKYRSLGQWQAVIDHQAHSGLGVQAFCTKHGLTARYFYRKRRQLRAEKAQVPTQGAFVRISPSLSAPEPGSLHLSVYYRECQLHMPLSTDPLWLARLLRSL